MSELRLKCASGFGDTIYIHPVAKYFLDNGEEDITIMTNYPDIFADLPVKTTKHTKDWATHKMSYCGRKGKPGTSQFQDVLLAAGVPTDIKLEIPWEVKNRYFIDKIAKRSKNKPYVLVAAPYKPFGRDDGFGNELTIDYNRYDKLLGCIRSEYYIVQIGHGDRTARLKNIDMDLFGKTTPADVMDLTKESTFGVFPVGHMLPIYECLGKPGMCFFSKSGLDSEQPFINTITPEKVIHDKKNIHHIIDSDRFERYHAVLEKVIGISKS